MTTRSDIMAKFEREKTTPKEASHVLTLLPPYEQQSLSPAQVRGVATLERRAPLVIDRARKAGVGIVYLGVSELFNDIRVYAGDKTDWTLGPVGSHEQFIVPRKQQKELDLLRDAGLTMPLYIAHEQPKGMLPSDGAAPGTLIGQIDRAQAAHVVPAVPPPAEALRVGDQLDQWSQRVLAGARKTLIGAGIVAIAPAVLVGAAAVAVVSTMDPIVLGAIPAVSSREGDPAAWYVLTRWDW